MHEHVIIFDAECPFCHKAVREIIDLDTEHQFLFAPLGGATSRDLLTGPQEHLTRANSLVLVENYRSTDRNFWIRSRAIFRTYWLIGNQWALFGAFSFLPCWVGDWLYRSFAAHRHQFKLKMPEDPGPKDRFLP